MKEFNAKKYKLLVKLIMPVVALVFIGLSYLFVLFLHSAVKREAQDKGTEVHHVINEIEPKIFK